MPKSPGVDAPWSSGRELQALGKIANIADAFCKANGGPNTWKYTEEADDGFLVHAPVGSLQPNAFGLHDMHGNVMEWCRDTRALYPKESETDPVVSGTGNRIVRGGCWSLVAAYARAAVRNTQAPAARDNSLGVRPAMLVVTE